MSRLVCQHGNGNTVNPINIRAKGMLKIRVYLVEDQALIRESLKAMLELEPDIEVVNQAAEAGQIVQRMEPPDTDVVLMDIGLPGMDGIRATRLLKEIHPRVVVVMLTSYQDEYLADALEAGATGYILKSSSRDQLVQAVRAAKNGNSSIDPSLTATLVGEIAELRRARAEYLLTPRQMKIVKLVANGTRYPQIAGTLSISETTVNREMRNVYDRMGVDDAAHAVSEAYRRHLL